MTYDVVICGGGIAGLWLLNVLGNAGYKVLLVEQQALGGTQTMASQGIIHGGQKYLLLGNSSAHAQSVGPLPKRWDACLDGVGELDLRGVRILSDTQVMWPTSNGLAHLAIRSAAQTFQAKVRRLKIHEVPLALAGLGNVPVYELPERVLDTASLIKALAVPHGAFIRKGRIEELSQDGRMKVSGVPIKAQFVICAAGIGNEALLEQLGVSGIKTQRRPVRQIMIKSMEFPLYGHGVTNSFKPHVTISSHPLPGGKYVWYLGGGIADDLVPLTDEQAIDFAKWEMKKLFSHLDWEGKQWASWHGFRAEAYQQTGRLPEGPDLQVYGNILVTWPTKLTLTPLLADRVLEHFLEKGLTQKNSTFKPRQQNIEQISLARYPWEIANWRNY